MPDYSCCVFCPSGQSDELLDVCFDCDVRASDKRANRMIAGMVPDEYDPFDDPCFGCPGVSVLKGGDLDD